jgi:hypothetical protein
MASFTKITRFRRKLRNKKSGRAAAARRRIDGTTPKFPIHTPEIDAAAPEAQVSPKGE